MKKRVVSLESYDRSTTREYGDLSKDMSDKYKTLKTSEEEIVKLSNQHYKSILSQIAYLNSTVSDLQKRVESPESANKITSDIESLKKGMADTGGDITEVKDKIKQLTHLAGQQHRKVEELTRQFFNLSVQVAQVMGKPTPKSPQNTGTPPLILRIPVSSDQSKNTKDKVSFKNVTATISAEVARVMGIVTTVNHTLSHEVSKLRILMKSLLMEVKKHVATIGDLQTKVSQILKPNHSDVMSVGHLGEKNDVMDQVFNLSLNFTNLSEDVHQHSQKLAELMLEVIQVNRTVYHHQHQNTMLDKSVICNCSAELGKLWGQLSSNKLDIESVRQDLQALQKPGNVFPQTTPAPNGTVSVISVMKDTTQSQQKQGAVQTGDELEREDIQSESITPSPSPASNASISAMAVEELTKTTLISSSSKPSSMFSPSKQASSAPAPVVSFNSTAPLSVVGNNFTENSKPLPTVGAVEEKGEKLSTPSSEETLEESLENAES